MERPLQESFTVGEWRVEPRLNQICRGEEIRQLDPRIMDVLVCLAGRPGEGITKDELLDAVWGDVFVAENTLSQAVSRLRKALGDDWRDPAYIKTISKTGYRLVAQVDQTPQQAAAPEIQASGEHATSGRHSNRDGRVSDRDGVAGGAPESHPGTAEEPLARRSTAAGAAFNRDPQEDGSGNAVSGSGQGHGQGEGMRLASSGTAPRAPNAPPPRRAWMPTAATALAGLALVVAVLLIWRGPGTAAPSVVPLDGRPVVTLQGQEAGAALSPDGTGVAFAWGGPAGDNWDIYLKLADGDHPQRLTQRPEPEVLPAWSPDGRHIALARRDAEGTCEIVRMPAIGGPAERLGNCKPNPRQMAWSDDGRWLAFAASQTPEANASRIYMLEVKPALRGTSDSRTAGIAGNGESPADDGGLAAERHSGGGEARPFPLTFPPQGSSDSRPAFSPDGRLVTFQRQGSGRHYQLMSIPLPGMDPETAQDGPSLHSSGGRQTQPPSQRDPRALFHEPGVRIVGHDWTPEGQVIISLDRAGRPDLWRFDPESRQLGERLTAGSAWVSIPRTARRGRRFIYDAISDVTHLYALDLEAPGQAFGTPRPLLNSTRSQRSAHPSPDGSRIAFLSDRSGTLELWTGDAPGTGQSDAPNLIRHTDFKAPLIGAPSWSPDGKQLIFDAYLHGQADLFSVGRESRSVRRLTEAESNEVNPAFSADGQWIYFASDRSGAWQVHRKPAQGGASQQITQQGGFRPLEDPRGDGWFYSRYAPTDLWRVFEASLEREPGRGPLSRESASIAGQTFSAADGLRPQDHGRSSGGGAPGLGQIRLTSAGQRQSTPVERVSLQDNRSRRSDGGQSSLQASARKSPLRASSAGDTPSGSPLWSEELIGGPLGPWDWGNWVVNRDGFYAVGRNPARIDFYPFPAGRPKTTVIELDKQVPTGFPCLSISTDGRTLYFTLIEQSEDEILLADY